MKRLSTVELHKDEFSFSAGHFTIFSATEREDLHGHNYNVSLVIYTLLDDCGLSFDYRLYKKKMKELCEKLDRRFMLPSQSNFLKLEDTSDMLFAHYGNEKIPFLKRDVVILPISNVTIEELSHWFLNELLKECEIEKHHIQKIKLSVYNGPGQSSTATWKSEITR